MAKITIVIAISFLLLAMPLSGRVAGNAQEPLPTPRGQLGGPAPLQLTPDSVQPANPSPTPPPATSTPAGPLPTATLTPTPERAPPGDGATNTAAVVASVRPAVVTVITDAVGDAMGSGSGFFIDEDGHVMTSVSSVENGGSLAVVLDTGEQRPATLVGDDPLTGLALLLVEGDVPATVPFAAVDSLSPGDTVLAFGTAYGMLPGTVTSGIVSVRDRRLPAGPVATRLIQHDAQTPRGMDGGPLVSAGDEVVGVSIRVNVDGNGFAVPSLPTVDLPDVPGVDIDLPGLPDTVGSDAALSFAVPADRAAQVASAIISDGRVAYPYLGVSTAPVTEEIAVVQGLGEPVGVVIDEVVEESPAAAAGLATEDVIVAIDGEPFRRDERLTDVLYRYQPGDRIALTVVRDGDELSLPVILAERPIE